MKRAITVLLLMIMLSGCADHNDVAKNNESSGTADSSAIYEPAGESDNGSYDDDGYTSVGDEYEYSSYDDDGYTTVGDEYENDSYEDDGYTYGGDISSSVYAFLYLDTACEAFFDDWECSLSWGDNGIQTFTGSIDNYSDNSINVTGISVRVLDFVPDEEIYYLTLMTGDGEPEEEVYKVGLHVRLEDNFNSYPVQAESGQADNHSVYPPYSSFKPFSIDGGKSQEYVMEMEVDDFGLYTLEMQVLCECMGEEYIVSDRGEFVFTDMTEEEFFKRMNLYTSRGY